MTTTNEPTTTYPDWRKQVSHRVVDKCSGAVLVPKALTRRHARKAAREMAGIYESRVYVESNELGHWHAVDGFAWNHALYCTQEVNPR